MKTAIVLAGGLGTRLQKVVKELPKPMAKIGNKPFLEILLCYLREQNIKKVILSVGYKKEMIQNYFGDSFCGLEILYSKEKTPLGTGGAIKKALRLVDEDFVFVFNGDTFFDVDLEKLKIFHQKNSADISIALKKMENFKRYGSVLVENDKIVKFNEKKFTQNGYINGGVYILRRDTLKIEEDVFSFEEFLSTTDKKIYGLVCDGYFIDIGIPQDYYKAQKDLARWL